MNQSNFPYRAILTPPELQDYVNKFITNPTFGMPILELLKTESTVTVTHIDFKTQQPSLTQTEDCLNFKCVGFVTLTRIATYCVRSNRYVIRTITC